MCECECVCHQPGFAHYNDITHFYSYHNMVGYYNGALHTTYMTRVIDNHYVCVCAVRGVCTCV